MALTREAAVFNPSSPRSSVGGAESFKGTPDTRLTAFSPEEGSAKSSRLLKSLRQDSPDVIPSRFSTDVYGNATPGTDRDPFITADSSAARQKLSPTASAFQPFSSLDTRSYVPTPDCGQRGVNLFSLGQKDECDLSQCLNIVSSTKPIVVADLDACFTKLQRLGLLVQEPREIHCKNGGVCVRFGDIRDAVLVHDNLHRADVDFEAEYISESRFLECTHRSHAKLGPCVTIVAVAIPPGLIDAERLEQSVKRLLQSHCHVTAYYTQQCHEHESFRAVAEFIDPSSAMSAVIRFDNRIIEGAHITVSLSDASGVPQNTQDLRDNANSGAEHSLPGQDLTNAFQALALSKTQTQMQSAPHGISNPGPTSPYPPVGIQVPPFTMWPILCQPQFQPGMTYVFNGGHHLSVPPATPSPTGHSVVSSLFPHPQRGLSLMGATATNARPEPRRLNAARVSRSPYYSVASHHNHVDVNRIREGTDVRTTIMLRNIPNKVDQAMLKRIVDESSWGKYDFMYLRIDFANDCNVGYAFINFVDPLDIIDFVNTRGNQRWNCFKSDKVAEISYATIQGKDCLVQKFRNSSVMLEAAHYRPKLFYTSNGPVPELAGEEEPFPQPDNQSKMKRSCENAEHVGLFTPNAGQHFRDEQRRRRSQYDRGTRLAALEEHDFEANLQQYMYHPQ
ncbi:meiosis protein mei2 [Colletotrichum musicola]|uniref:Meiosis protein mei2 n=1 Tax=Colletotrichum musicola TaxID=2175873 RepID=A0A8H6JVY7_9PEZI|nr:meiosis protein mei2 [Colletotrichum musicola]